MDKAALELDVYAGKNGDFALVEDDGVSEAWRQTGEQTSTAVAFETAAMRVVIHQPSGLRYVGAPTARSYLVRFHGYERPVGMRIDGGPSLRAFETEASARAAGGGVVWDGSKRVLSVLTPAVPGAPRSAGARLADALAHRDFIYVVIGLAAFGQAAWFLFPVAIGTPLFVLVRLWADRRGRR